MLNTAIIGHQYRPTGCQNTNPRSRTRYVASFIPPSSPHQCHLCLPYADVTESLAETDSLGTLSVSTESVPTPMRLCGRCIKRLGVGDSGRPMLRSLIFSHHRQIRSTAPGCQ